uniref:OSJNBa0042D13.14 protein n=1 Tax=Oryza sativa subsp. japonica TaxID=39947 RepID=Q7XRJ6_ORYSJ|nr:OSJNBa0042D13.14 [Oryza sativa Japonica Group]
MESSGERDGKRTNEEESSGMDFIGAGRALKIPLKIPVSEFRHVELKKKFHMPDSIIICITSLGFSLDLHRHFLRVIYKLNFRLGRRTSGCDILPFVEGILAAHCSTERTVRACLDGFKNHLRAKDDELGRKNLEMEALVNTLKEAKAENKWLQSELEKGKEAGAEVDRLKAELEKEKAHTAVLIDYYNLTEPKMEALRQEVCKAEASTAEESRRFSQEMVKTTESARTACQTLRLALTDMGAKVRGDPSEDASVFDFSEWTQQAGGSVSDCATAYGDCYARVTSQNDPKIYPLNYA